MLFFEMVKILKERQPRFFIAENVKGLLSANKGKAFHMIIKEFENAGYKVMHKLLNASEYGVPQKRVRVIIVGFRDETDLAKFNYPTNAIPPVMMWHIAKALQTSITNKRESTEFPHPPLTPIFL